MDLYLQFGYGMMQLSRDLIERWGGGTVILSPRDLSRKQLVQLSHDIKTLQGKVLFDPQFYLPHADHGRLTSHEYWPASYSTGGFWTGPQLEQMVRSLVAINDELQCESLILPGLLAESIDEDWLRIHAAVCACGLKQAPNISRFATISLSADVCRSKAHIHSLLDASSTWEVDGFYLVCQHPGGQYLVTDAAWLANVMDLCAGLRLRNKKVVVGYCSHQLLVMASCHATAIASGTWLNVRSFPPSKFSQDLEDEIKQRATWYYAPHLLSEYKLNMMDICQRLGLLDALQPTADFDNAYCSSLFTSPQPSASPFSEKNAFPHYLDCLCRQAKQATRNSYGQTLDACATALDTAEAGLKKLHGSQIRGQQRDFLECVDVGRAALAVFEHERGPVMRRLWSSL